MADFEIIDTDKGMKKAIAFFDGIDGYELSVGIFEGSTVGEFGKDNMTEKKENTPIAEYAGLHEFGSEHGQVSEKRWFRDAIDGQQKAFDAVYQEGVDAITSGKPANPKGVLIKLGSLVQKLIRESITRKGLVDTGAMRWAVRFEIRDKNGLIYASEKRK